MKYCLKLTGCKVSDFDTVVSENEHFIKKQAHCFDFNVPAVLAVEPLFISNIYSTIRK